MLGVVFWVSGRIDITTLMWVGFKLYVIPINLAKLKTVAKSLLAMAWFYDLGFN